jgi:hypothetical protein
MKSWKSKRKQKITTSQIASPWPELWKRSSAPIGVPFSLDSRVTGTTREYTSFRDAVKDVNLARVLAGFHFRNSTREGSNLGRAVGRYVAENLFQPLD